MSNLKKLNAAIADLRQELAAAEQTHNRCARDLVATPGDPDTRTRARATGADCAALRNEITILSNALRAAEVADQTEESLDRKRQAVAHLREAERLVVVRDKAGQKLDQAMAAFAVACKSWDEVNAALRNTVSGFCKTALFDDHRAAQSFKIPHGGIEQAPGNALLVQFDAAVRNIVAPSMMALNYRARHGIQELVAVDAAKTGERLVVGMTRKASDLGLKV